MSLRREDMLRELELLPVWKLREPPAAPVAAASPIATPMPETAPQAAPAEAAEAAEPSPPVQAEVAVAVVEPATPEPVAAEAVVAPLAEEPAEVSPVEDAVAIPLADDPAAFPPWDEVPVFDDVVDDLPPLTKSLGDGRRETIMKLDWQGLQDCVPNCEACGLAKTRTQTVFGVGDPQAEWLIVGEAPGAEEDRQGEPFVGQAGKLLDNMLAAIKLKRGHNVYIANVLKCRPPENRDPHGEEVTQCDPFLKRQVELIKPKLIIALGKFAAQSLLASDDTIAAMRGKLHSYNGVPVIVTYHPAYLLRNLPDKAKAWEDLCFAVRTMQGLQTAAGPAEGLQSSAAPPSSN